MQQSERKKPDLYQYVSLNNEQDIELHDHCGLQFLVLALWASWVAE